jgi:hypothetical protein
MTSLTDIIADIRKAMEPMEKEQWVVKENLGFDEAWCDWHEIGPFSLPGGRVDLRERYIIAVQPSNIAAVLDALEMAERERDASKEEARMAWSSDEHQAVWAELKARAEAAEAALKEAVELLKPFAAIGKNLPANRWPTADEWQRLVKVHIADLLAAERFLENSDAVR